MPYIGTLVAVLGFMFVMFKYFESRIDKRFDAMDKRIDSMDQKFEAKFDAVDRKIDNLDKKFEAKFAAIDKKFEDKLGLVNQQIFHLALALRPHVAEVETQNNAARKTPVAA